MFSIDPSIRVVKATREQVATLVEAINEPNVAVPGEAAQPARAWVIGVRNPTGTFSIAIYLWLAVSRKPVVYLHEKRWLQADQYAEAEGEAVSFCESMGFMLDNLNFRNLDGAAQTALLAKLPPFSADPVRLLEKTAQPNLLQQAMPTGPTMSAATALPSSQATPGPQHAVLASQQELVAGMPLPPARSPAPGLGAPRTPSPAAAPAPAAPLLTAEQLGGLARLLASF